uniref:Uncharacterized protein n=1 Tax=Macrostomum lignano TaxID=282301 RepID=A0A1I8J8J0_9PLAT
MTLRRRQRRRTVKRQLRCRTAAACFLSVGQPGP